jgi:hypothetical protein
MAGNNDFDWDAFAGAVRKPAEERFCLRCQHYWTSRAGSSGWNRCPNCRRYYCTTAAEGLVEWARLAREQAARRLAR